MKNKISLSFGLALLVTGFCCFWFEIDDIIMFGVSFSSLIFSGISIVLSFANNEKYELVYIIPFIILLSFCCYGDSLMNFEWIKDIVNSRCLNAITFFSFGTIFLAEYISKAKEINIERNKSKEIVEENLNYSEQIVELIQDYMNSLEKRQIIPDNDSKKFITKIVDISQEKIRQAQINNELLKLNKNNFDFNDINKIFIDTSSVINIKNKR